MKGALLEVYRWLVLGRDESARGRLGQFPTWQTNPPPQTEPCMALIPPATGKEAGFFSDFWFNV